MDGGVKSPLHFDPPEPAHSHHSSLDGSVESGWSLDKIVRSMEQKANSFENLLTPLEEDHMTTEDSHMTNGQFTKNLVTSTHHTPLQTIPVKPPKPPVAKKPKPTTGKGPASTSLQGPAVSSLQGPTVSATQPAARTQPHKRTHVHVPKAVSPPPDLVQISSNGKYSYSSGEDHTSIALNKKRPEVPDLTTLDPRKPKLKVKKVPRSVWKPRPMARTIESSSSESDSDGSDYSVDTVVGPGDSSTLRSAHV